MYMISFFHLHTPSPFSPSLISPMVSVDVKHHVYLLTLYLSLISLMVSVDVKHHVYLLTLYPSLISLMVSVDVKHHVYLLAVPEPCERFQ